MAGGRELDRRRFKELVLYAIERAADHPRFGSTKLNKILFFSDFEAYRRRGVSITGAEYKKRQWGPAAHMYPILLREMQSDHEVKVSRRRVIDFSENVPELFESRPNPSVFTEAERQIIDEVIDDLRERDAGETSDLSHERSVGWRVMDEGETIPYETVLISSDPPSDESLRRISERALAENWKGARP